MILPTKPSRPVLTEWAVKDGDRYTLCLTEAEAREIVADDPMRYRLFQRKIVATPWQVAPGQRVVRQRTS